MVPTLVEGVSNKIVLKIYAGWRAVLTQWVVRQQEHIRFGSLSETISKADPDKFDEFEGDEVVLRKEDMGDTHVVFNENAGLKRRGDRKSLFLKKRDPNRCIAARATSGRAAPPPLTKTEWVSMRDGRVGSKALGHFDGAPPYEQQPAGSLYDKTPHSGRNRCFTKLHQHIGAAGETVLAQGRTQSLDGWWKTA